MGKGLTPCDNVGTQFSEAVERVDASVNTETVDDNTISVDNNESFEPVETLAEVVFHNPDKPSQPTITVSCGETGDEGMDGVVSEVTAGEVFEEEMAEVDKVSDVSCESPLPPPLEEGANATFPAPPLGKKVVTEGREEGPNEGEG